MIGSSTFPQLPVNVRGGLGVGVSRQNGAVVVELQDIALATAGTGSIYTVASPTGVLRPKDGLSLLLRVNRPNSAAPQIDLDNTGARPWTDVTGAALAPGALATGFLLRTTYDAQRNSWFSDRLAGLTLSVFDALMKLWLGNLPQDPDGLGPTAPWNNGGTFGITNPDNVKYDPVSAAARIDLLRLVAGDLPTSSVGLAPGEPWLNGTAINFVPRT